MSLHFNIHEADHTFPAHYPPPDRIKARLKPHQSVLLHRCISMETGPVAVNKNKDTIDTRFAILGDKVGSGKSVVLIALIFGTKHTPALQPLTYTFRKGSIVSNINQEREELPPPPPSALEVVESHDDTEHDRNVPRSILSPQRPLYLTRTTLLIVPHFLVPQWKEYLTVHGPRRGNEGPIHGNRSTQDDDRSWWMFVNTTKSLTDLKQTHVLHNLDLLVVASTFYRSVEEVIVARRLQMRRVVLDEVDSMVIPSFRPPSARSTWLVTASYSNLFDTNGTMRSLHCLRSDLLTLSCIMKARGAELVVRATDSFVDESFNLPAVRTHSVICKEPALIRSLCRDIDVRTLDLMNAGDIAGALNLSACRTCNSEITLVNLILSDKFRAIDDLRSVIRESEAEAEAEAAVAVQGNNAHDAVTMLLVRLKAEERGLVQKVEDIRDRITRCDACPVCFDHIRHKTVVPCCSNAYCFKCIRTWLSTNNSCPMCKTRVTPAELNVVSTDLEALSTPHSHSRSHTLSRENDKITNFRVLLHDMFGGGDDMTKTHRRKLLVFSQHDGTFGGLLKTLDTLGARYAFLKGTPDQVSGTLSQYTHGDLNILLANANNYGCGLNLEMTTDIIMMHGVTESVEHQVIGRAQRHGRTCPLDVWYLLFENESTTV